MKYMLDSSICIHLIRKQPSNLVKRLTSERVGDVGVSVMTVAELQFGVSKSQNPEKNLEALEQFLLPLALADFDFAAATTYGQIRSHLERQGTPKGSIDMLIAAHAVSLDVTLVTNNVKELSRVPELSVEDWTKG